MKAFVNRWLLVALVVFGFVFSSGIAHAQSRQASGFLEGD